MHIKEWSHIFLKQRDIIKKEIAELVETKEGFHIRTKTGGEKRVIVNEELKEEKANIIICLNSKKNIEQLVKEWNSYAKEEKLLIVFANPKTNEKWLIKPHNHNKISDKESLKQGLMSMYDAITNT